MQPRTWCTSSRVARRVLWAKYFCRAASLQLFLVVAYRSVASAWTAAAPLGRQSTAKEVVDRYAPGRQLSGCVAVVTGGNSGIGLETVKVLSSAGCRVILASRSLEAGQRAVEEEIRKEGIGGYAVPDADVEVKAVDLADLGSVIAFAQEIRSLVDRIDFLVLNAGVMALPNLERTRDGFEMQIGVNHFGHALLTRQLLPIMEAQATPSRIVTLSSVAHQMAEEFDVANLHFEGEASNKYSPWSAYGSSKLANALFAQALSKRLPADGKITSVSVHPGVIRTNLWRSTPANNAIGGWLLDIVLADKTIPQGAATTLWACLSRQAARANFRGAFLADCGRGTLSSKGQDDDLAESLWKETEQQLDNALENRGLDRDGRPVGAKETADVN